ncbi:MAG: hypothetical protein ABJC04_06380, partial [Verrucomicrobiota bacterium]
FAEVTEGLSAGEIVSLEQPPETDAKKDQGDGPKKSSGKRKENALTTNQTNSVATTTNRASAAKPGL